MVLNMPQNIFTDNETAQLYAIRNDIKNNKPLCEILEKCEGLNIKDNFAYLYAGVMLASYGRTKDSLVLYDSGKCTGELARELFKYIKKNGSIQPKITVFKTTAAYDAWVKTNLYKVELEGTLKAIAKLIKTSVPAKEVNILDIGPGNGKMTTQIINHILLFAEIKKINLVLLDKFPAMLDMATKTCMNNIKTNLEIRTVCGEAQHLTKSDIEKLKVIAPFWLTICSRSIHHMPWEQKQELLKLIRTLTRNLFIVEMEANHDIPEKDSPEIVYSVNKRYSFIFNDIYLSPISGEEKRAAIDDFLLIEAIMMLIKERANRIDYHTPAKEWAILLKQAEFEVVDLEILAREYNDIVHYFAMVLK